MVTRKVDGKGSRGRSLIRWFDQIRTSVYEALHIAEVRKHWRNIIRELRLLGGGGHDLQTCGARF